VNLKNILKSNNDINDEKIKNLIAENYSNFDDLEKRILSSVSKIQIEGVESQGNSLLSLLFQLSYREQVPLEISKKLIISNYEKKEFPFYFFNIANGETEKTIFLSVNHEKLHEIIMDLTNEVDLGDLFEDTFLEKKLASKKILPTEENLKNLLGIESYKSFGQKFSLSQVANAHPGDCSIINLPTGSGKTLIGWFTHLSVKYSGVTVLVLPTIGLEQDQYERAKNYFQKVNPEVSVRVLYSATIEIQKKQVIQEIEEGRDLFLILSPDYFENLQINKALKKCARKGKLKNILIDEGHMIQEWGLDFRPEFLSMIYSIKLIFEISKTAEKDIPKVFIFSGTFDQTSLIFLKKSFDFAERIIFFGSSYIRRELNPRVIKHNYPTFDLLVKDLLFITPKPAIIYTDRTEIKTDPSGTAINLFNNLSEGMKLKFTEIFTGKSDNEHRKSVIEKFSGKHCVNCFDVNKNCKVHMYSLDTSVVVATKAFGLGIDVDNVRSIIHIGLPQNIHEYYQQLGRGGRDGNSTLCLLFYNENDENDYKNISHKILTWENILPRWKKMFETTVNGDIKVDINTIPTQLTNVPTQQKANRKYNLETLNFLMLSGLIEKTSQTKDFTYRTLVEFDESLWEEEINKQRNWLTRNVYKKDINSVLDYPNKDIRELFSKYYQIIFEEEMEQVTPIVDQEETFEILLKEGKNEQIKLRSNYENSYYFSPQIDLLEKIDEHFDKSTVLNIFTDKNYEKIFNYEFKNIKAFVYKYDKNFENSFVYKSRNMLNLIIYNQPVNLDELYTDYNIINLLKDDLTNHNGKKLTIIKTLKYL
jgi:superfamily II DNA helicase RecQ